jgi:hypothetical protein
LSIFAKGGSPGDASGIAARGSLEKPTRQQGKYSIQPDTAE